VDVRVSPGRPSACQARIANHHATRHRTTASATLTCDCGAVATLSRFLSTATLPGGLVAAIAKHQRIGGFIMTIGSVTPTEQAAAITEVLATNDVRTLVAKHLGVSVRRVTDEAHFTDDLGADWLDRLELMMVVEDQFSGVEITDADVDRMKVVGDLITTSKPCDGEALLRWCASYSGRI
jgi:acyl carrier protein